MTAGGQTWAQRWKRGSHYASGSRRRGPRRPRSPRGDEKHVLESRRVQWLGPPSPSAGQAVLAVQGSHDSDSGVQYHVMRRLQAAGPHGGDGVQYRATGRYQTAESRESEGDVQYQAMKRFPAAGPHESESSVQYRATKWCQVAGSHESESGVQYHATGWFQATTSTLNEQGGDLRQR